MFPFSTWEIFSNIFECKAETERLRLEDRSRDLGSISTTCLHSAYTCADPKSVKIQSSCQYLFALLGSACVKAAHKMLIKLTPVSRSIRNNFGFTPWICCSQLQEKEKGKRKNLHFSRFVKLKLRTNTDLIFFLEIHNYSFKRLSQIHFLSIETLGFSLSFDTKSLKTYILSKFTPIFDE